MGKSYKKHYDEYSDKGNNTTARRKQEIRKKRKAHQQDNWKLEQERTTSTS